MGEKYMNHSNLRISVDVRRKHPYGVHNRLQFFAHKANVILVPLDKWRTLYAIVKG